MEGERIIEPKYPQNSLKNGRRGLLYKYPSQNATSRRRNFTRKKLDVYGGLEMKAKDLSTVFRNEFTKKNTMVKKANFFEEEIGSLEAPTQQPLVSEPSMLALVTSYAAGHDGQEKNIEKMEDEKKSQEDGNKVLELKEDDKKNQMDLGICEVERNKRLESLIARRRARKQLKLQIENNLINMKSILPSQIEPLLITRVNPFVSPKEFDGFDDIEMPGSAPSVLRSPFDIPYDPFEEKPNLTGGGFDQEFISHQKDMLLEPKLDEVGNHDKDEKFKSKEVDESELKVPVPQSDEGNETVNEMNEKRETDMAGTEGEEEDNIEATKSISDNVSNQDLMQKPTNIEEHEVLETLEPSVPQPQESILDLPISSANATKINDSLYESLSSPIDKSKEENMSLSGGLNCHTPSCSLASDLHVEVSEVGSPTVTVDDSHDESTTDEESIIYDGDVDKDVTSGSEDMWGASLHLRELRRVSEQNIQVSWKDIGSPLPIHNIDEENAADVSSMSSMSEMPDDTPTYTTSKGHNNMFGNMKGFVTENTTPQPSHSSVGSTRLMQLMDTKPNCVPYETQSENPRELFNSTDNSIKAEITNDENNSSTSEQNNMRNSKSDEEPSGSIVQQDAIDEVSMNLSSPSSPGSVLSMSQKTTTNPSTHNEEIHLDAQDSNMHGVAQEALNNEGLLISMDQDIQPSVDDPNVESYNSELSHPQVSLISLILESASTPKKNEEKSQELVGQEATMKTCNNDEAKGTGFDEAFEGKHLDLNENEAMHSSCKSERESNMLSQIDKPNHSSEEVNCLKDESKQVVENHTENEKLDNCENFEDSPLPITTEVINFKDVEGEYVDMKENKAPNQELNENETVVSSELVGENDQPSNIKHMDNDEKTSS
ncbi:hypothetical protein RJT34_11824 [Clitoria ternatea]|uniref:Uncharacterized protein n=1 Tax=Clitoria ternatea TaxID=43366 RepID=A0AAN9JKN3_CLITE